MKTCFKCNHTGPLSDFYPHKRMADGHLNKCIKCTKADAKARREAKKKDPEWMIKERARCRVKFAKYRADGRYKKYPRAKYPMPSANKQSDAAIRTGKIKRLPCEICGKTDAQGHHEDYAKPMDLKFLCARHHADRHIHFRECELLKIEPMPFARWAKEMKK